MPGLISLIFLPVMCYFYLLPYSQKNERILEITFADKYKKEYAHMRFDTSFLSDPRLKRNFKIIEFTGYSDKPKLDTFQSLVHKIIKSKDTVNGVHLIFQEHSKYKTFVQSINILKKESSHAYAPFENHLWTLYMPLDKERLDRINHRKIEEDSLNKVELIERSIDKSTFSEKVNSAFKVWCLFIGIFILVVISIYKVVRNNYK